MIPISETQKLIDIWQERAASEGCSSDYKIALSECIFELNQLIDKTIEEEFEYQEMIDSWQADDLLDLSDFHDAA